MADRVQQRDFFISFNKADEEYAKAIDAALRDEGFSTFYHPRDLPAGGNIPIWMDDALMNSAQTLALYSPSYTKDKAVYSKAERYATWWQDPVSDKRKLIPILIRETQFTPLMAVIKRIEVTGLTAKDAAIQVVKRLRAADETEARGVWRRMQPLPKIFRAPYRPNPNFTGRFEALESLHHALSGNTAVAVTAVAGLGGIGKTTLAAEYCHRFGGQYGGVWTIRAERASVLLADLQSLGHKLGFPAAKTIDEDARNCLDHLASITQPWLLVYDNVPNPDAVRDWLPAGAVRTLITSRFTEFGSLAKVSRLDKWPDDVTASYILTQTDRNESEGATRLAKTLDGLPLAAEQAAVFLHTRKGISFDDYANDITRLIKLPKPEGSKGEYPDTVYAAFVKSLEALRQTEAGKLGLDLLRLCAFLSPDGVDLALLVLKGAERAFPSPLGIAMADKFIREDAFAALMSLSLVRQDLGPAGRMLVFHRLLLEVARDWMGEEARGLWGTVALRLVTGIFPYEVPEPAQWPICGRLLPHVFLLEAHAPRTGVSGAALSVLLNQSGLYLDARGDRLGALAMLEKSLALARQTRADEPLVLAITLDNLGATLVDLGRLDEADAVYGEARKIKELNLDADDPLLAVTLSNFAELHMKRRRFSEAEVLLLRVSNTMRTAHGDLSPQYAKSLSNLGNLYNEWASEPNQAALLGKSEQFLLQALALTLGTCGSRHPGAAICHSSLGTTKARQGKWSDAAVELERAVSIMLSLNLPNHPSAQEMVRCLAYCWEQSGQLEREKRVRQGDLSDFLPVVAQVEAEHRDWVAKDPENRKFVPHSALKSEIYRHKL